jgi:hypothetical protein
MVARGTGDRKERKEKMKIVRFALPACLCFGFIVGFAAEAYADYRTTWYQSSGITNPCTGTEGGAC